MGWWTDFRDSVLKPVATVAAIVYTGGAAAEFLFADAVAAGTMSAGMASALGTGIAAGGLTAVQGGSPADILKSAITAGTVSYIGGQLLDALKGGGVSQASIDLANATSDPVAALNANQGWTQADISYLNQIGAGSSVINNAITNNASKFNVQPTASDLSIQQYTKAIESNPALKDLGLNATTGTKIADNTWVFKDAAGQISPLDSSGQLLSDQAAMGNAIYHGGMTAEQAAQALGVPPGSTPFNPATDLSKVRIGDYFRLPGDETNYIAGTQYGDQILAQQGINPLPALPEGSTSVFNPATGMTETTIPGTGTNPVAQVVLTPGDTTGGAASSVVNAGSSALSSVLAPVAGAGAVAAAGGGGGATAATTPSTTTTGPEVIDRKPDWVNPNPTPDPTLPEAAKNWSSALLESVGLGGMSAGQVAALVAAGALAPSVLAALGITQPTAAKTSYGPLDYTPLPAFDKTELVQPGLNPGLIPVRPYYETTNELQPQYYWGKAPYIGTTADVGKLENIPGAPATPFGYNARLPSFDVNRFIRETITPQQSQALAGAGGQYNIVGGAPVQQAAPVTPDQAAPAPAANSQFADFYASPEYQTYRTQLGDNPIGTMDTYDSPYFGMQSSGSIGRAQDAAYERYLARVNPAAAAPVQPQAQTLVEPAAQIYTPPAAQMGGPAPSTFVGPVAPTQPTRNYITGMPDTNMPGIQVDPITGLPMMTGPVAIAPIEYSGITPVIGTVPLPR